MPIIMHDFITGGFTANTGLSRWCHQGTCCCTSAMPVIDHHPKHGIAAFSGVCVSPVVTNSTPLWSESWKVIVRPPSATSIGCVNPSFPKIAAAATSSIRLGFHARCVRRCLRRYSRLACPPWSPSSATTPYFSSVVVPRSPLGLRCRCGCQPRGPRGLRQARNAGRHLEKEPRHPHRGREAQPRAGNCSRDWKEIVRIRHRRQARRSSDRHRPVADSAGLSFLQPRIPMPFQSTWVTTKQSPPWGLSASSRR